MLHDLGHPFLVLKGIKRISNIKIRNGTAETPGRRVGLWVQCLLDFLGYELDLFMGYV